MKVFRVLLCVVLSLAMALGMVGAYAEPAAGAVTLRNVVITLGEEEFALNQEAKITARAGQDGAALRFEILNGDRVLLPVAGEIDAEGVRFTLDDSGRVYTVDMAMLMEMMDLDAEALAMLQMIAGYVEQGIAAVSALADPANSAALENLVIDAYTAMLGAPTEVEMDINGVACSGISYKGGLTTGKSFDALDVYMNTGIAEWDQFMQSILSLLSASMGVQASSFADLKAVMLEMGMTEEDLNMAMGEMEMILGGNDDIACLRMIMDMPEMDDGIDAEVSYELIATETDIDMTMTMDMGPDMNVVCTAGMSVAEEGKVDVDAAMNFDFGYDYTYEDGYTDAMTTAVIFNLNGENVNGLWTADADFGFASETSYGYEGEVTSYTDELGAALSLVETAEADGSITSSIGMALSIADGDFGLGFDLNRASGVELPALIGENSVVSALTEDTESVAYTLLSSDAMGLMADVMELSADETIASLAEIIGELGASYDEYYYDEAYDYEDGLNEDQYYEEYEDYEDYEVAYTTVSTFEEAAAIYPYEIPAYTAPEGYALSYIDVSAEDLYAEYTTADGMDYIGLYVIDFGMEMTEPGATEIAYYDNGEGSIVGAEVIDGSTYVSFYFVKDSQAEADAIVAGLSF